ncbi:hypothetical protein HDU77_000773 [Chytriomyces hyalinus]|nr:hypothetical protein HDU77_000773 [Chytriomyces hyalinus]
MKKQRISYSVKSEHSDKQHCAGVNALALDVFGEGDKAQGLLYSGGRDASVHAWGLRVDFAALREESELREFHSNALTSSSYQSQRKFSAHSDHISIPPRGASISYAALSQTQSPVESDHLMDSPTTTPMQGKLPSSTTSTTTESPHANQRDFRIPPSSPPSFSNHFKDSKKSRSVSFFGNADSEHGLKHSASSIVNEYQPPRPEARWSTKVLPTTHVRTFQAHSDWVNDIALCNRNQSIVTASNDRMVYLWSTTQTNMYMRLGYHSDHVKCLAYSSSGGWVASGGLDRRVMIWDTQEGREKEIVGFAVSSSVFCHDKSPKSSIYALACNPAGTTLVSGSPDKIVRVWDPRTSNGQQTLGLLGHRDNIRALLISEDGKWVLSASSDSTIKLWSLAQPKRSLVTYTHYDDSVWCLYSHHPDLDTFWAGGRDGVVTKVSRRRMGGGVSNGGAGGPGEVKMRVEDELVDCVAICKEEGPVHKLVAVDDMFVWTATGSSSINRWRDIPFRHATIVPNREMIPDDDTDSIYIPKTSIIQHQRGILRSGPTGAGGAGMGGAGSSVRGMDGGDARSRTASVFSQQDSVVGVVGKHRAATGFHESLHLRASSMSQSGSFMQGGGMGSVSELDVNMDEDDDDGDSSSEASIEPVWEKPEHVIRGAPGIITCRLLNNRMHVVTEDTGGQIALWDIVKCVKLKVFGEGVSFEEACGSVNTFEWIAHWCALDTKNGYLTVHLDESKFSEAEVYYEQLVDDCAQGEDLRVNIGKWVLAYLFISYKHAMYQQVPPAAVMYHDHYLGALTYTQLGAPPESTSHYLFGQSVYYGPPDLLFDPVTPTASFSTQRFLENRGNPVQQENTLMKEESGATVAARMPRKESLGAKTGLDREALNAAISITANGPSELSRGLENATSQRGEGEDGPPPVAVRLRPKAAQGLAARPESIIQAESALNYVKQIIQKPVPYSPNPDELPLIRIPPDVSILVSCEESSEAACYLDQFRSTVGQIGWVREAMRLDECIPRWVSDTLMDKKLKDLPKVSFTMNPHPYSNLPELPNNANRLSSNRMIRLRKLLAYVADNANIQPPTSLVKLALSVKNEPPSSAPPVVPPGSPMLGSRQEEGASALTGPTLAQRRGLWTGIVNPGSVEAMNATSLTVPSAAAADSASVRSGVSLFSGRRKRSGTSGATSAISDVTKDDFVIPADVNPRDLVKPEEYLELCCQDRVLDPKMTLGTVKNLIWKSGSAGDFTLTFRRKDV